MEWVYGGEYNELYRLIIVVVKGWLAVGLQPHFVFDGRRDSDPRLACADSVGSAQGPLTLPSSAQWYHE